eukprot:GHUV01004105.1.p1 GENE.GHUV01004105.1~~GHUV01004105.1.p1  ORF type:complete len:477 (+),score=158.20 GHUV01004105.1:186-1616(+)
MRDHSPIPPPRVPKSGAPRGDPYGSMPPERYGREADRRAPPPTGMGRRRRSLSPPYRGREDKRHRRDDDYYRERQYSPRRRHSPDYGRGYDAAYDDAYYQQPPPPPKRGVGNADERNSKEPKTFKRFLMEDVPDNVSPMEAQRLFEQYLTGHFGDQLRARFEQEKTLDTVRAAYHPSAFESSLTRHKEDAATAAQQLAEDIREGRVDPASDSFNQGVQEAAEATENGEPVGPAPAPEGPASLWKPDRVAADFKVAKRLVALVDHQRGLNLADNPLLPKVDAADGAEPAADGEATIDGGDATAAEKTPDATFKAVVSEIDSEEVAVDDEESLISRLGQLDMLLTWLWRVHGIDYYGGKELLLEADYMNRGHMNRTVRGQRPEEGEEQDEDEAKADRDELAERVDKVWAARLEKPDPLVEGCKREEIEKRLDEYVQSQIKMENDKKWVLAMSSGPRMFRCSPAPDCSRTPTLPYIPCC